jgi:hypothetical protein
MLTQHFVLGYLRSVPGAGGTAIYLWILTQSRVRGIPGYSHSVPGGTATFLWMLTQSRVGGMLGQLSSVRCETTPVAAME